VSLSIPIEPVLRPSLVCGRARTGEAVVIDDPPSNPRLPRRFIGHVSGIGHVFRRPLARQGHLDFRKDLVVVAETLDHSGVAGPFAQKTHVVRPKDIGNRAERYPTLVLGVEPARKEARCPFNEEITAA